MQLSPNLNLKEATKSTTALRKGIDNTPSQAQVEALHAIATYVFQPLRDYFGVPIAVTSGYRSRRLNRAIGGSRASQHCNGEALDLDADVYGRVSNAQLFHYIREHLPYDMLIWELGNDSNPAWVHVSYRANGNNRHRALRAVKVKGKTIYREL